MSHRTAPDLPPFGTSAVDTPPATPLPAALTGLIGRVRELDEIEALLATSRLLTLTGAGGSGKTRLAQELTARAAPLYDDVAWIELATLSDAALIAQFVAGVLGVNEEPGGPLLAAIAANLRDRRVLLVLDNCEHLLDAATALAESLLRACPRLTMLATSRQALGVGVEAAWLVPLLDVPRDDEPLETLARCDAVRLFVARAQGALPTFTLDARNARAVAHLCRRLEGLPLAIELAAARVRVLHPQQIADRLDDAFRILTSGARTALPRHRTLRGVIDWSHALLTLGEQRLFARLSVFSGGFALEQAEHVCAHGDIDEADVLDLVAGLVDKSLVLVESVEGATRYRMLETVRQFAREQLRALDEEETIRRRHCDFFLALAEGAERGLLGGASNLALIARIELEDGNLRAAAEWCEESEERAELSMRFGSALHWLWFVRGHFAEGRHRLELALARGRDVGPRTRGRALSALGSVLLWQGEFAAGMVTSREAVALLREESDPYSYANALMHLGASLAMTGQAEAHDVLAEAVERSRHVDAPVLISICLYWQGLSAQSRGEHKLARDAYEEAIDIGRKSGNHMGIAHPLYRLGWLECDAGNIAAAQACFRESFPILLGVADRWGMVQVLDGLAFVAIALDRPVEGVRLLAAAEATRSRMGVAVPPEWRSTYDRLMKRCRELLTPEAITAATEEGRVMPLDRVAEGALSAPAPAAAPARRASGATPSSVATSGAPAGGTLQVLALGPLEVRRDGEALGVDRWGSAKARELLLFLACHPDGCSREQVGIALWPDASSAQLRNVFHVTLHRLRKALDRPGWIVLEGDRYRLASDVAVEMDATVFEREVLEARRELSRGRDAFDRMRQVLSLYRGDFLAGEPVGDWHLELRDRLERLCVDALLAMGGRLMDAGRFQEAADAYRGVLERDELHEESYRHLMVCLSRAGDRTGALRLYQRLVQLLRDELDTAPAPETARLFAKIQAGTD